MGAVKYCQIVEREMHGISIFWKLAHLLFLLIAAVGSIATTLELETVLETFGGHCVFNPKLVFTEKVRYNTVGKLPTNVSFHNALTIWGDQKTCSFCKGAYLFSMIVAMIMLSFFIIIPKGGFSRSQYIYAHAWKIVPPATCTALIMLICILIAYNNIQSGLASFTDQIYEHLENNSMCGLYGCDEELNIYTLIFHEVERPVTRNISGLKIASGLVLVSWLALLATLLVRMFLGIDFQIVIYNIRPDQLHGDTTSSVSSTSYQKDDVIPVMERPDYDDVAQGKISSEAFL